MKLVKIKPTYFRGFGDSAWVDLDNNLTLIHAPNGFGKTSLAEAIEWLFYGKTNRRERGEALSQREYLGSYRNAHSPNTTITSVEGIIRLTDGTEHSIRRELTTDIRGAETNTTYVDGNESNLDQIGISNNEVFNPVIAQDGLQDFIHSRPKERRDKISSALGLDSLVRYKSILYKARGKLQIEPPANVVVASGEFLKLLAAIDHTPQLATLQRRWQANQFNLLQDKADLKDAALGYLGSSTDIPDATLLENLVQRQESLTKRIFDKSSLELNAGVSFETQSLKNNIQILESKIKQIADCFTDLTNSTVSAYSQVLLSIWKQGLEIHQHAEQGNKCPLCEEDTLTSDKRRSLSERISTASGYTQTKENFLKSCQEAVSHLEVIREEVKRLLPTFMNEEKTETLKSLFPDDPVDCNSFVSSHDALRDNSQNLIKELGEKIRVINLIPSSYNDPSKIQGIGTYISTLWERVSEILNTFLDVLANYNSIYESFEEKLQKQISTNSSVLETEGFISAITNWEYVRTKSIYNLLLADTLFLIRRTEEFIQQKQNELFNTRGQEINDLYNTMNPNAEVKYTRMEPTTDNLTLIAETFGIEINAAACLSQCQLNCLGLSINLVRARTAGTTFDFLFLDDPVQSMDDDHCQAFISDVISRLLGQNIQLIVCSHEKDLISQIESLYRHESPINLRISEFQQSGPTFIDAESLTEIIAHATSYARGNEDNRRAAVGQIRRGVESLIRATCILSNSPEPSRSQNANEMLVFFQGCPNVTAAQYGSLRQTINFCNPAPHTQVGYNVPVETQITPHINRLRQLGRDLGIIS